MNEIIRGKIDSGSLYVNRTRNYRFKNEIGVGYNAKVYEAFNEYTNQPVAIKMINPIDYKCDSPSLLRECKLISKGLPLTMSQRLKHEPLSKENLFWFFHPRLKQYIVAYEEYNSINNDSQLYELPLSKCIELFGLNINKSYHVINSNENCARSVF